MVEQKDKIIPVDFDKIIIEILTRVSNEGLMGDMVSWRRAFPDVNFMEVDEDITGKEIEWEKRTAEERAFFVAYMKDPQAAKVWYQIDIEDILIARKVDDAEKIWCMWMAGCFTGETLDEEAIRTFLWYADDSELARKYIADLDLDDAMLLGLSVKVAPL